MITIKRWDNDEVIYTSNKKTIQEAVKEAVTSKISLAYADLSGADLSGVDLSKADLVEADLSGADLSNATLFGADLFAASLYGAKIDKDIDIRELFNIK